MAELNEPPNNNCPAAGNGPYNLNQAVRHGPGVGERNIPVLPFLLFPSDDASAHMDDSLESDDSSDDALLETPKEELPEPLPLTPSAEQEVGVPAPTSETNIGNLDLDPELEGGSEFDIIYFYFNDDGSLLKRNLLAINDSKDLQLDLIQWMKNAEQRKHGQQQLQPEDESSAAVLHQDFASKDKAGSDKLLETPTEEKLPAQLSPPTSSAQRVVEDATKSCTSYFDVDMDGNRICVKGSLLEYYQKEFIRALKKAEQRQRKREQQQLQSEGRSAPAVVHQDFVPIPKDKASSGKLIETPSEEELPGQVSLPTSSAQEVDANTDPNIGNAVAKLSEVDLEICRWLDNKLCFVQVPRHLLERHCQVCAKHSDVIRTMEWAEEYLRQLRQEIANNNKKITE